MKLIYVLCVSAFLSTIAMAQSIVLPASLSVPAANPAGASFTYNGTLTDAATLSLTQVGTPCLVGGNTYCTNGAGVIVTPAANRAVGGTYTFAGTIGGTTGNWTWGALLMSISGVGTVQVFPSSAANGAGSGAPPNSLSLAAQPLSALGFGAFTVSNPTITFYVADNYYTDNSYGFTLTQQSAAMAPVPSTLWLAIAGIGVLALWPLVRHLAGPAHS